MLVRCDGTEDDLREALSGKHPKTDAPDDSTVFNKGKSLVLSVEVRNARITKKITRSGLQHIQKNGF